MRTFMERFSLLSLSFLLVSTFSISPALPQMIHYFKQEGYSSSQVEALMSYPSLMILLLVLISPWLGRRLSNRLMISMGLILLAVGGTLPLFTQSYRLIVIARLLLGIGIGLINAKAITLISERFSGRDRVKMLGLRGSTEVMGSAILTLLAGQLSRFGWSKVFAIYSLAVIVLGLYWLFVPEGDFHKESALEEGKSLTPTQWLFTIGMATYAGFVIVTNSINTLRIPVLVDQMNWGTPTQSSFILSSMMLMGILAGLLFSRFLALLKDYFMMAVLVILGVGLLLMWQANSVILLSLGALTTGLVYSLGVTYAFHILTEKLPRHSLSLATTIILVGCNLGGGGAAWLLSLITRFTVDLQASFLILGGFSIILGLGLFLFSSSKLRLDRK